MRRLLVLAALALGCSTSSGGEAPVPTAAASPSEPAPSPSASAAPDTTSPVPAPGPPFTSKESFDLLIDDGTLVDGSGGRPLIGDVLVDDGRIVHVGQVDPSVKVERRIDARGKVVAPGFIDTHAHGDAEASLTNFLAQGVTTICLGQDGASPSNDRVRYWKNRVGKAKLAVNVVPFVGHGTVRSLAKVGMKKGPSDKELERMAKIVEQELEAGAWGLTTGLEYRPGSFADVDELVALAKPVAAHGGVVMSHLRSEDDDAIEASLDELIAQGEKSGAKVHVSHIKVVYGRGVARAEALLEKIAGARLRGVKITADIYPYEASYTTIGIVFPDFARPPNNYDRARKKRRDELASYLRERIGKRGGPEATLFGSGSFTGMTLEQAAEKTGKPFEEVLMDIGPGGASAAYFVMDDALQARLLLDPFVMISTDGGPYSSHPRGYGAFAKVIRDHVVERKALSLVEAVRKMTGFPAETLGLPERGHLKSGYAADLVVFEPEKIRDRATYEKPRLLAEGMDWVVVNGAVVVDAGAIGKRKAGRLLLKER
jgi:N-acyl-D-amino-acid deacylase